MEIKTALIPAAGKGMRLKSITGNTPKELLIVYGKPMIGHVIEEARLSGIKEIAIVISPDKKSIKDYVIKNFSDLNFNFITQKKPKGLGDAILLSRNIFQDDYFSIMLPDNIGFSKEPILSQLIKFFTIYKKSCIGLSKMNEENTYNYGMVSYKKIKKNCYKIIEFRNKTDQGQVSIHNKLGAVGRYILEPDVFELLKKIRDRCFGEFDESAALNQLAEQGKLYGFLPRGKIFHIGDLGSYNYVKKLKWLK